MQRGILLSDIIPKNVPRIRARRSGIPRVPLFNIAYHNSLTVKINIASRLAWELPYTTSKPDKSAFTYLFEEGQLDELPDELTAQR